MLLVVSSLLWIVDLEGVRSAGLMLRAHPFMPQLMNRVLELFQRHQIKVSPGMLVCRDVPFAGHLCDRMLVTADWAVEPSIMELQVSNVAIPGRLRILVLRIDRCKVGLYFGCAFRDLEA